MMDKAFIEQVTAYELATYNLNKSLVKLSIYMQNETRVPTKIYQECLERIQPVRDVVELIETWLKEETKDASA